MVAWEVAALVVDIGSGTLMVMMQVLRSLRLWHAHDLQHHGRF